MPTGSIRASSRMTLDEWHKIYDDIVDSSWPGFRPFLPGECGETFWWSGKMITFTQITQIESIRRQIEQLQVGLTNQAKQSKFGYQDPQDRWHAIDQEFSPALRETLCKVTVAKIVKLLDEAAKLGVDTDNEKKLLLEFLQELAPKDPPS